MCTPKLIAVQPNEGLLTYGSYPIDEEDAWVDYSRPDRKIYCKTCCLNKDKIIIDFITKHFTQYESVGSYEKIIGGSSYYERRTDVRNKM